MRTTKIKRVHTTLNLIISVIILALGLALIVLIPSWKGLGYPMALVGLCMVVWYKTGYLIEGCHGLFKKTSINLPHECIVDIKEYIEGKQDALNIDPYNKGGLLMEVYTSHDGNQKFAQLFDYVDSVYTSRSDLIPVTEEKVKLLATLEPKDSLFI